MVRDALLGSVRNEASLVGPALGRRFSALDGVFVSVGPKSGSRTQTRTAVTAVLATLAVLVPVAPARATHDAPGLPLPAPLARLPKHCLADPGWTRRLPDLVSRPAPGLLMSTWHGAGAQGVPLRVVALQADAVRVGFTVSVPGPLGSVAATTEQTAHTRALAGLNGDYFDPGPAGAVPRGVEVHDGTVLYATHTGTRVVGADGQGQMSAGLATLRGTVTIHDRAGAGPARRLSISSVNNSRTAQHGVSMLTAFGARQPRRAAWFVLVNNGTVRHSSAADPGAPHGGDVLLMASASGRKALSGAHVGDRIKLRVAVLDRDGVAYREALGRGGYILRDRAITATCTGSYGTGWRPRSVIAWNAQLEQLWFITVNSVAGGSASGPGVRGFTYAQIADVARRLGASDAVLVDGGHSTILVVRRHGAGARVDTVPGAGQRLVPVAAMLSSR
jgi:Phosphodiester glycosidase